MRYLTFWEKVQLLSIDDVGDYMLKVLALVFIVLATFGCAAGIFQILKWGFK